MADRRFNVGVMFGNGEMGKFKAGKGLLMLAALDLFILWGILALFLNFIPVIGSVGMLLAVPLTMVLKVILESSDEFRWIGVAISSEQPAGVTEETLLEVTPPEKSNPAPLTVGAESI